jgi:uncharacterized protein with HEPN domain
LSRSTAQFLRDARDMAWHASTYGGLPADVFAEATDSRYSAVYCLIIVGEALNKVPPAVQTLAPEIPWREIIDMRHILVHAYWRTDYAIVHEVVRRDCDELIGAIDRLLPFIETPA